MKNLKFHVKLYEKSPVKRAFLKKIKEKLDIKGLDIGNDVYDKEKNSSRCNSLQSFQKIRGNFKDFT